MTDKITHKPVIRGGGPDIVVNFDDVQHENKDLKEKNEELNQKLEQLQNENDGLRGQLQYYQNLSLSIGTVSGPI